MRQETYRFALDEATTELHDIVNQFEALKAKKEQIEKIVEALRPFIGLQAETPTVETSAAITAAPEVEHQSYEPVGYTFMQISGPGMEVTTTEPARGSYRGGRAGSRTGACNGRGLSGASCLFPAAFRGPVPETHRRRPVGLAAEAGRSSVAHLGATGQKSSTKTITGLENCG